MRKIALIIALGLVAAVAAPVGARADAPLSYDIVIYGGTAGGVAAAIEAARMGKSVAIIEPTQHLGGMTTNGLSFSDTGNTDAIQGVAREFYMRLGAAYGLSTPVWNFEPHVAENVLNSWVAESSNITVYRGERLNLTSGVVKAGATIQSIAMESGLQFNAGMYIDAGYEGDLMAKAGVSYAVGREANTTYNEKYNGFQVANATKHQFTLAKPVDPYRTPGVPSSGLLPGINASLPPADGTADNHIQSYNFRLTVTKAANRIAWTAPAGYDAANYELLRRYIAAEGITSVAGKLLKIDATRNGKYDINNQGPVSTDFIGMNYAYPDGNYATRDQVLQAQRNYQQGLIYFLANDPGLPASIRTEMQGYGLAADEFTDNGGWSGQMYIREARRMVGRYVMTDRNCRGLRDPLDPIALASYTMDSHNVERYVDATGHVRNEGDVEIGVSTPYSISYGSITPQAGDATNLLVSTAISASHIAYGSIRMEPVFMELGQAAGAAAALALDAGTTVQNLSYATLQSRLVADGALVAWPANPGPAFVGKTAADFNDFTTLPVSIQNQAGGSNLAGNWTGTGTQKIIAGDLATAVGGYCLDETGTGLAGKLQGNYNARRQSYRSLASSMTGTIWLSVLLQNPDATAHAGLSFNEANNADPASFTPANYF
ncbi:MAG: FAD-dependent oxidoreductase, partial [Planctomycetota bacterium]|nr:FAD-dependent oxidoreductase [Planctomycetota bacterium]